MLSHPTPQGLEVPSAAPPALQQLLSSCLAPRPENRPSFQQVVERLQALEAAGFGEFEQQAAAAATAAAAAPVVGGGGPDCFVAPGAPAGPAATAATDGCSACTESVLAQAAANPPPVALDTHNGS